MPDHVETRLSPTRYHTEFGRSRSNSMGVGNGRKKNWGRWGPAPLDCRVADPYEAYPSPRVLPYQIWSLYVKHTNVFTEIPRNNVTLRVPFQGHSRLLELTRIDRYTCDFLLGDLQ